MQSAASEIFFRFADERQAAIQGIVVLGGVNVERCDGWCRAHETQSLTADLGTVLAQP
jgi:hypothetical protein